MKKRILALLLAAVMLVGALCGCGKKNEQEQLEPGLTASLVVSCQGESEAVLTAINDRIVKFQTQFPGVQVTLDTTGGAEANIVCASADQLATYWKDGKLLDLDVYFDDKGVAIDAEGNMSTVGLTEEQQSDLVEMYLEEGKQLEEKSIYMLPLYRESVVLYYNGTYLEERELDVPHTWEIIELLCQEIKSQEPEAKPLVCRDVLGVFLSLCAQFEAEYTAEEGVSGLLASEGAAKAAQLLNSLAQKGYLYTEDLSLQDQGVYMVLDTSANLQKPEGDGESYSFELGVMPLPSSEEMPGKVLATGTSMGILRTDDDDQMLAAWLLAKALCTDVEFQANLAMAGNYTPVMTSVETYETYSDYLDGADGGENIGALTALGAMEQQHKLFTAPVYEGSLEEKEKLEALVLECIGATDGVEALLEKGIG